MLPLSLKIAYTAFVCVLVPVYFVEHGPSQFLWFSNIALLGTMIALWRESPLIASMMMVGIFLPEVVWNISFLLTLFLGDDAIGLAGYMFDEEEPVHLRILSAYHIPLPFIMVWLVYRLGYDSRALKWQTVFGIAVILATALFTDPERNINWVFAPEEREELNIPVAAWVGFLLVFFPLAIHWPTHVALKRLFGRET